MAGAEPVAPACKKGCVHSGLAGAGVGQIKPEAFVQGSNKDVDGQVFFVDCPGGLFELNGHYKIGKERV
jgi:hypothetical protein